MSKESTPVPIENYTRIHTYVQFHDDEPTTARVTSLSYFDLESAKALGLELRLDVATPYCLVFEIVGASVLRFRSGSVRWGDPEDLRVRTGDYRPPAVEKVLFPSEGRRLEIYWIGDDETPYVNMFDVLVYDPDTGSGGKPIKLEGRLDPTIINKPPEEPPTISY